MILSVQVLMFLLSHTFVCVAFSPSNQRLKQPPIIAVNMMKKSAYERVLEKPQFPASWPFTEEDFTRMDEADDTIFYNSPRL